MQTEDIRLYDYWRSSASYRVRIGLNLLGIGFESEAVDLVSGIQRSPENLARNRQGLVPTLGIDGIEFTQSLAILEYLNETRHAGWLPSDPLERARVRALAYAIAMEIHAVCNLRVARHAVSLGATMEGWMQHFIAVGLADFETMLGDEANGGFCYGDGITIADLCLVPQVYNARRWNVDLSGMPKLCAITERLEAHPAFAAAHPDRFRPQS